MIAILDVVVGIDGPVEVDTGRGEAALEAVVEPRRHVVVPGRAWQTKIGTGFAGLARQSVPRLERRPRMPAEDERGSRII